MTLTGIKITMTPSLLLLAATLLHTTTAYPMFTDRLPNGDFIPHPCMANFIWKGVGHEAVLGGGPLNPFGRDFANNGFKWDSCICEQDSDGDGLTNGEEMGDPDCTWTRDQAPKHKFGLSHPGVCEPMESANCRNRNMFEIDCAALPEFTCDEVNSPGVRNVTFRIPETQVPTDETTYMCMTFDLDADQEYHMIAYEPIIINDDVMHHLVIFGCTETENDPLSRFASPTECAMMSPQCRDMLGFWGVGATGNCLPKEYGFPLGLNGFKTIVIQMHWTNPTGRSDFVDSSGMKVYYTPNLRANSAKTLRTGQVHLRIPPGRSLVPQDGECSSECTSRFPHPVQMAEVQFHMHYLGRSGYTELWRDGVKVTDLIRTDDYDYDRPEVVRKSPTVELQPGDYLKTRCNFNSRNRDEITFYGASTYDEMCFSIITYYPALPFGGSTCASYMTNSLCDLPANRTDSRPKGGSYSSMVNECAAFLADSSTSELLTDLFTFCDATGATCKAGCQKRIDALRVHPCMQFPAIRWVNKYFLYEDTERANFQFLWHSCDTFDFVDDADDDDGEYRSYNGVGGSSRYDPDENGLPSGGVCPWGGNESNDAMATTNIAQHMVLIILAAAPFVGFPSH